MKPNFLIIGAGRCGTTSLCAYLDQHADVFISTPKEPGFFTEYYDRGWAWYESLFSNGRDKKAIGEGSNNYSKRRVFPAALPRIACDLPDVRLIYIVRHPLRRIESDWRYSRLAGIEPLSFAEAVRANDKYIDASDYVTQIDAYREHYLDERILVLFLEDMQQDLRAVMQRCSEFLGVDSSFEVGDTGPRNTGLMGYRDRGLTAALRNIPGAERFRTIFPRRIWQRIRPVFRKPIPADVPLWTMPLFTEVTTQLSANSRLFLSRYGKQPDFWRFEPSDHVFEDRVECGVPT